jgi:glycosyltransferase involved in cell wall biosynthesis
MRRDQALKITNRKKTWIEISDISVRLPPSGKGDVTIREDLALKSKDLDRLVSTGAVEIVGLFPEGIAASEIDGRRYYVVPSTDVWGESGVVRKYDARAAVVSGNGEKMAGQLPAIRKQDVEKRFMIERAVNSAVSVDGSGIVLNKHMNATYISAKSYFSDPVQKAVASKVIRLVSVEECVDGEWIPVKFDVADPSSAMARSDAKSVFWEGPVFDGGGYANMNRQYIFNLDDLGICVKPSLVSTLMDVEEPVKERIMSLSRNMIPAQSPKVYATNVPGKHFGRSIAYTMMETENRIHPLLVHKLTCADEIWVPCEWNRQVFAASGVKQDMKVMPLGVDVETYAPRDGSVLFSSGTKKFVFLSVFNWNWRKGPDVMLKAYLRAFTSKDEVSMVMVSRFIGQKSMSARIFDDIKSYVNRERSVDRPHLALVDDVIPTFMMPLLYNSASACVQISRGEGFGLPACEAMASGVPLLASDHGGHRMFLDADVATLVAPDCTRIVDRSIEWISPFYHGMEFVDYSSKAIDAAAEKMRWMYENQDEISAMAAFGRRRIVENFNWRRCATNVKERLEEIQP